MKMPKLTNKILEVWAAAYIIVQHYGYIRKFAKHIAALVIKQITHLTDIELADFFSRSEIERILGYKRNFNPTIFSKVRKNNLTVIV
jgi:hypothetical protein